MLVLQEFDHIVGNVARVKSKRSRSSADGFVALVTRELGLIVERV
jgi:hypothetical protein